MTLWKDLPQHLRCDGISIKYIAPRSGRIWHLTGWNAGAEGAMIQGPIRGLWHMPYESVWTEPAYGAPEFERTVDGKRTPGFDVLLMSDTKFGWFDTEAKWWEDWPVGVPGWLSMWTRRLGELWIPVMRDKPTETEMEDDPAGMNGNNHQIWTMDLAQSGNPRWRRPAKVDRYINSGKAEATLYVANQSKEAEAWPVFFISAPAPHHGIKLANGNGGEMVPVPELLPGEHCIIDTDPTHRIAISATDPADDFFKKFIRNSELLSWLLGHYGDTGESVLKRFHGQGFTRPIAPGEVGALKVIHPTPGGKVGVLLPQRFERAHA